MAELIKTHGKVNPDRRVFGATPTIARSPCEPCVGSQIKGPCSRIDLLKKHADIDILAMYPAGGPPKADGWTLDVMLKAAEACHKGGNPFGIGLGTPADNVDTAGAIFQSFGAALVDDKGKITVKSDPVRQSPRVLHQARAVAATRCSGLGQRLQQQVPGFGQGLADHEPAERLGRGQARCAAGSRTVLDARHALRAGRALRAVPALLLGHLELRQEQVGRQGPAAVPVAARLGGEDGRRASAGYDLPSFEKLTDFKTWAEIGPPKGTLYHYPNPYNHQILSVAAAPAPPKIAVQIYTQAIHTKMIVRILKGEPDGEDARLGRRRARRLTCARKSPFPLSP